MSEDFAMFVESILFLADALPDLAPFHVQEESSDEEDYEPRYGGKVKSRHETRRTRYEEDGNWAPHGRVQPPIKKRQRIKQGEACWAHYLRHQRCTRDEKCKESALRFYANVMTEEQKRKFNSRDFDAEELKPFLLPKNANALR
jgi:hypothetical protein